MEQHPRRRYTECQDCHRSTIVTGKISARGLCEDCAMDRQIESAKQLIAKSGPYYDEWKRAMAEVGADLAQASG